MYYSSTDSSRHSSPSPSRRMHKLRASKVNPLYAIIIFSFSVVFQFVMDVMAKYSRANIIVKESAGLAGKINRIYTKIEQITGLSPYYLGIFSYAEFVTCMFFLIHSFDGSLIISPLISVVLLLDMPLRLYIMFNPAGFFGLVLVMLSIYYINKFYNVPLLYHALQAAFSVAAVAFITPGAAVAPAIILALELCQEYPVSGGYFSPRTFFQALRLSGAALVVLVASVALAAVGCGIFGVPSVRLSFDRSPLFRELVTQPHNVAIACLTLASVFILFLTPERGRQRSELLCVAVLAALVTPLAGPNSPVADAATLSVLALVFAGSVFGRYSVSLPIVAGGVAIAVFFYFFPLQGEDAEFVRLASGGAKGVNEIYEEALNELKNCGMGLEKAVDNLSTWEIQQHLASILKIKAGEAYEAVNRALNRLMGEAM